MMNTMTSAWRSQREPLLRERESPLTLVWLCTAHSNTSQVSELRLWVCVRGCENYGFLKPVKVTIEHCLGLDRDTDTHSLGLTFMKAGHTLNSAGKYELQSADGAQDFQSDLNHGTLTTDHFCFFCISAKDDHEIAKRNG